MQVAVFLLPASNKQSCLDCNKADLELGNLGLDTLHAALGEIVVAKKKKNIVSQQKHSVSSLMLQLVFFFFFLLMPN